MLIHTRHFMIVLVARAYIMLDYGQTLILLPVHWLFLPNQILVILAIILQDQKLRELRSSRIFKSDKKAKVPGATLFLNFSLSLTNKL